MFKSASCSSISGVILLVLIAGVGWFPSAALAEPVLSWRPLENHWPPDGEWHIHQIEVTVDGLDSETWPVSGNFTYNGNVYVSWGMNDLDGWYDNGDGTMKYIVTYGWDSDVYDVQNSPDNYFDLFMDVGNINYDTWEFENIRTIGERVYLGNYSFNIFGGNYPAPAGVNPAVEVLTSFASLGGLGAVLDSIWAIIISMCCVVTAYTFIRNRLNNFKRSVK